jgi:predicted AAA+ superfamily ATPase
VINGGLASKDEVLYLDFEDYRLKGFKVEDLDRALTVFVELTGKQPKYLLLDEVQVVEGYGSWFRRRLNSRVCLSGSSSLLTPLRIAEELRGRSVNYEVYPSRSGSSSGLRASGSTN